jgi:hypothetical protein
VYLSPERAMFSLLITFKGGVNVMAKLFMEEWSFLEPAAQSFCGAVEPRDSSIVQEKSSNVFCCTK